MTATYNPFYDVLAANSNSNSTEGEGEEGDEDWPACGNYSGFAWSSDEVRIYYTWDGLPLRNDVNDRVNTPIAASMILFGLIGVSLNVFCARVIYKNSMISSAVKYYLFIDCYCRFNESCTELYKAYCVISWECVNTDGLLMSGILINRIVTAFNLGMIYSMQMIGNGLCCNRVFAVFFEGRFYPKIERIAFPHGLFLWAIPIISYCYQIGDLVNAETGFVCYGCWYFSPLEYCNTCLYARDSVVDFLISHCDHVMYGVLGVTLVLDVLTLWRVRKLTKRSDSKRRADVRLSVMLVTTHFITICFLAGNWIVNNVFVGGEPIYYYLILEVCPFIVHSLLGIIVIIFNLPFRGRGRAAPSTNGTVVSTATKTNARAPSESHLSQTIID